MRTINLIVIHCTASRCTSNLTPSQLEAEHRRRGFTSCGYHYYVRRSGEVVPMRPVTAIGAHAKHFNAHSIGIAYEGGLTADGVPSDTRTAAQRAALVSLLKNLHDKFPEARILGHRELSPDLNHNGRIEPNEFIKQCPCFDASTEYAYITAHNPTQPKPTQPKLSELARLNPFELPLPANQNKHKPMKKLLSGIWRVCKLIAKFVPWIISLRDSQTQR